MFVAAAQLGFGEFGSRCEIDVEEIDLFQRGRQPLEPVWRRRRRPAPDAGRRAQTASLANVMP
jgi:hypothetical protein